MEARRFFSFSTELLKIATGVSTKKEPFDADLRELYAERRGDEKSLPGGQLPTNSLEDEGTVPYPLKIAASTDSMNLSSGVYNLKARKKKKNTFQAIRDYGMAGTKGAFLGIGGVEATRKLMGRFEKPEVGPAAKKMSRIFQTAAVLGAGASMAERAYRYHRPKTTETKTELQKTAIVAGTVGRTLGSPARSLAATGRVGSFQSGRIHMPRIGGSFNPG